MDERAESQVDDLFVDYDVENWWEGLNPQRQPNVQVPFVTQLLKEMPGAAELGPEGEVIRQRQEEVVEGGRSLAKEIDKLCDEVRRINSDLVVIDRLRGASPEDEDALILREEPGGWRRKFEAAGGGDADAKIESMRADVQGRLSRISFDRLLPDAVRLKELSDRVAADLKLKLEGGGEAADLRRLNDAAAAQRLVSEVWHRHVASLDLAHKSLTFLEGRTVGIPVLREEALRAAESAAHSAETAVRFGQKIVLRGGSSASTVPSTAGPVAPGRAESRGRSGKIGQDGPEESRERPGSVGSVGRSGSVGSRGRPESVATLASMASAPFSNATMAGDAEPFEHPVRTTLAELGPEGGKIYERQRAILDRVRNLGERVLDENDKLDGCVKLRKKLGEYEGGFHVDFARGAVFHRAGTLVGPADSVEATLRDLRGSLQEQVGKISYENVISEADRIRAASAGFVEELRQMRGDPHSPMDRVYRDQRFVDHHINQLLSDAEGAQKGLRFLEGRSAEAELGWARAEAAPRYARAAFYDAMVAGTVALVVVPGAPSTTSSERDLNLGAAETRPATPDSPVPSTAALAAARIDSPPPPPRFVARAAAQGIAEAVASGQQPHVTVSISGYSPVPAAARPSRSGSPARR
ncbi:hypothetical protein [Micromonospora sp. SH-82]|uniref:hypothetical protein n=1 Tax=Micromonospora sp. SH-82 TaxID=3132938 RepID=UPI003EC0373E